MSLARQVLAVLALVVAVQAAASTIRPHSLTDRLQAADRVALVKVVDQRVVAEPKNPSVLTTVTDLAVTDLVKGPEGRFSVIQLGGTAGPWSSGIAGDARFVLGETAVVFVRCKPAGPCALVALAEGKIAVDGDFANVHDLLTDRWEKRPLKEVMDELKKAQASRRGERP